MPSEVLATKLTLSASEKATFSQIQQARGAIQNAFDSYNTVPDDIADSAYDLVGNSNAENKTINYYVKNQDIGEYIGNYTSLVFAAAGHFVGINLVVEVSFSDGSMALFKLTGLDSSAVLTFSLLSAIDQNDNNIPLTKSGYESGSFNFSENTTQSINNFLEAAGRSGVPIYNGSTSGGAGGGRSMKCKEVVGQLECTIIYQPR